MRSLDVVTDLETLDKVLPYYPTGKDFEEFLIQSINPVCLIYLFFLHSHSSISIFNVTSADANISSLSASRINNVNFCP